MSYTDSFSRDRDDGSIDVILDDDPKPGARERRTEDRHDDDRREEPIRDDRRSDRGQADLISGDEGIKRLRSDLDRVSRVATAADARAQRAEAALDAGRQRLEEVEKTVVDTELKSAEDKVVAARAKFKAAFDAADPDAIADAQEEIGEASADLREIKRRRETTESTEERRGTEGRVERELPADPVERFIVQNGMSPRNAEWLRNHPECVTDEEKYYQMHAADARARRDKVRPGSDEYYTYMEKELGYDTRRSDRRDDDRRDDRDERREERRPASERRPAAPPSRDPSGPDGRPSRPSSVRLNSDEREMAHLSFPDLKPQEAEREYARNKADLIANDPSYRSHERR